MMNAPSFRNFRNYFALPINADLRIFFLPSLVMHLIVYLCSLLIRYVAFV